MIGGGEWLRRGGMCHSVYSCHVHSPFFRVLSMYHTHVSTMHLSGLLHKRCTFHVKCAKYKRVHMHK
jgi:hypothetical protein